MASVHRCGRDCPQSAPDCWWRSRLDQGRPSPPCPCNRPSSIPHRQRRSTRDRAEDECCAPAGSDRLPGQQELPAHHQNDHRSARCRVGSGHQCWAIRIQTPKPADQVARSVNPNLKASLVHPPGQQGTSRDVLGRETSSTDAAIGLQPNGSHLGEGSHQTFTIGSNSRLGCRQKSDLAFGQEGRQCSGLQIKRSVHHRPSDPNGLSSMRRFNPHQRIQTGINTRQPRRSA